MCGFQYGNTTTHAFQQQPSFNIGWGRAECDKSSRQQTQIAPDCVFLLLLLLLLYVSQSIIFTFILRLTLCFFLAKRLIIPCFSEKIHTSNITVHYLKKIELFIEGQKSFFPLDPVFEAAFLSLDRIMTLKSFFPQSYQISPSDSLNQKPFIQLAAPRKFPFFKAKRRDKLRDRSLEFSSNK